MKNMAETITIPKTDYDILVSKATENDAVIADLTAKVEWLMEQFRLSQHRRFGSSSENANLPMETIVHELDEEEQVCPECEDRLHVIGKETLRRELKLIPAKGVIVEHIRKVYGCRHCEKDECSVHFPSENAAAPSDFFPIHGVPIIKTPVANPVIKGGLGRFKLSMRSFEAL